ncbi:hypothetical protein LTR10_019027 [Elasticomyces elasticus]|uniref:Thioredoxin-like fold domain-containing protein n=1 Tax=Exophiala sideris TaxID=1016849 RepID=A0ABR0J4G1_9EURO|nr:hypothetical protein LTR10_019027 [Elasticomyces elasticus]KAK5026606.1 hypothetical protein LTS07_007540 [Exophiala sideris]KAK5033654.1 hypothetical protein LTR13_006706 [Exophiala sideris]KAK5055477.1 hypothetical protein LTR69_008310 [Exophiala sideris]KAK5176437.1 hypothetical protein LTR44_010998 [Eurotiomycetes sp. CCFEE 6388]
MTTKSSNLILFRGWLDKGKYTWSPFVTKVEFRCRQAGLPYTVEGGGPKYGPKGKIPYVDLSPLLADASAGPTLLGDSTFIIQRLRSMGLMPDLNGSLAPEQCLHDLAVRALLEDKLYFYHARERWIDNFYVQRDMALGSMPYPVRIMVGYLIHRSITHTLHGQGVGRLTNEEIRMLKTEIWQSLDDILKVRLRQATTGEPVWCLGDTAPTEADATLFGFVVSVLVSDSAPESKMLVKSFAHVVEYAERIHDRYFPDYEKWI